MPESSTTSARQQHHARIAPPPLFNAPSLPSCFAPTANINLGVLRARWHTFGQSALPFARDRNILPTHWFWIWKTDTWNLLKTDLRELHSRTSFNYIEVLSVYLYDLAKLVLGGIIRTRKEFFEQFIPDFRDVKKERSSEIGDSASLTVKRLLELASETCYFKRWMKPVLVALVKRSSLTGEEERLVEDAFTRFCHRTAMVLELSGFDSSKHEQALTLYTTSLVSELPNKLSYSEVSSLLARLSPAEVREGLNNYLSPQQQILTLEQKKKMEEDRKKTLEQKKKLEEKRKKGESIPPAKTDLSALHSYGTFFLPGIAEHLGRGDPDRMEHSLVTSSRYTHRQRGIYELVW